MSDDAAERVTLLRVCAGSRSGEERPDLRDECFPCWRCGLLKQNVVVKLGVGVRTAPKALPVPALACAHRAVIGHSRRCRRRARNHLRNHTSFIDKTEQSHGSQRKAFGLLHLRLRLLLQPQRVRALLLRRDCRLQLLLKAAGVKSCDEGQAIA